jgi:hypothetical protein
VDDVYYILLWNVPFKVSSNNQPAYWFSLTLVPLFYDENILAHRSLPKIFWEEI